MKYNFREGVKLDKKKPLWLLWVLAFVILAVGAYGAAQFIAPKLVSMPFSAKSSAEATMQKMQSMTPGEAAHLFIPQLNVDMPLSKTQSEGKAWQKDPSNPEDESSTIVLRATYLEHGLTPWETRDLSPFHNVSKLQKDDEIYIDYKGKRYAYRITQTKQAAYEQLDASKKWLVLVPVDKSGGVAQNTIAIAEAKGVVATAQTEE